MRQCGRDPPRAGAQRAGTARNLKDDPEIVAVLDAALTVAYFSFVNRLVLLLGVELESDYEKTCGA